MRIARILMIAAAGIACHASAAPSPAVSSSGTNAELRALIDSMADAPAFANAHWGILIVDPERGDTLYSRNAGKLFMPASNMKILTSAVATAQLGMDYRYRTTFAARGAVTGGTLAGDLVVIGRGDPSVSDHMLGDAMTPIRAIADSISRRGVQHITGRVVAGGNAFPDASLGFGWSYDDFEDSYSAPTDELLFNEGFSEIHVTGGAKPGDPVTTVIRPAKTFPVVHTWAVTGPFVKRDSAGHFENSLRVKKDSATWEITLSGRIAPGDTATIEVTHRDADVAYLAAVREALLDRGIAIDGAASDTSARLDTLAVLTSPPLSEIMKALMKPSQNQIAEIFFRTIALNATGIGRSDTASAVVGRQIAKWGVAPNEAVIRDGSGLARYDYVSPRTLVRVLDAMRRAPTFRAYYDAMPIAGVDGTIRNRMKGTPAQGNVHAKTGTLAMARSLSGFVTTANQRMLIFSFLCNNWTTPVRDVERVQDIIAERLATMSVR
jgi:D-alanyl-D-alanine carboxypeptidase/D-alanyl-D-alanine-endopeptidase (penicillin-binding protein 4)